MQEKPVNSLLNEDKKSMGEKLLLHTASKNFSFTKSILKQQSSQEVLLIGDEKKDEAQYTT
ncbi:MULTISPECIES: hypothetical protein [Yersinia]|uniref:hypothetical protein n=1 Tax=Yersinia TaxID=629 RepID=UPI00067B4684|nr:hypothetical protein [Yersinia vastinensis]OVZ98322.1 hypothetical protein CBW53_05210 [Yersinia frederiksenii]RXA95568.1 hypothetical protein EQP49_12990 [Yersinia sp. 2105 StPb PI]